MPLAFKDLQGGIFATLPGHAKVQKLVSVTVDLLELFDCVQPLFNDTLYLVLPDCYGLCGLAPEFLHAIIDSLTADTVILGDVRVTLTDVNSPQKLISA